MFVTVWLGVLDLRSGKLVYANGGHNPPLYRHADGSVEWMRDRSGLLLGSFEGVPYRVFERTMIRGDSLILYTDGVTEAMDASDHCYGDERLFSWWSGSATDTRHPCRALSRRTCAPLRKGPIRRRHHAAGAALRRTGKRPRGVGGGNRG